MLIITELELPGFFPRPMGLTNGIVGALCAGAVVFGLVALLDWCEDGKWMWQEEGWVWPWERLLWGASVGGFDGAASTAETPHPNRRGGRSTLGPLGRHRHLGPRVEQVRFPDIIDHSAVIPNPVAPPNTPAAVGRSTVPSPRQIRTALAGPNSTLSPSPAVNFREFVRSSDLPLTYLSPASSGRSTATLTASPLSTPAGQPFIIPPTPFLPRGLRPIHLPPPTPAQIHQSGLLGESPQAPRFKHFSGDGFARTNDMMRVSQQWSKPAGGTLDEVWHEVRSGGSGGLVDIGEGDEEEGMSVLVDVEENGGVEGGSALIDVGDECEECMSGANGPAGST